MFEKVFVVRDRFDILVKKFLPLLLLIFLSFFFIKFRSLISSSNIKFILENKNLLHHRVTGMEERLFKKNLFPRSQSNFIKEIQIYIERNGLSIKNNLYFN